MTPKMNFNVFKTAVAAQFKRMQQHQLFTMKPPVVNGATVSAKETLYATYQNAFPKGSNDIFRKRPVHDCSCCSQAIRAMGNVVAFIDGQIETIWDVQIPTEPVYQQVASKMANLIRSWQIDDQYLHYSNQIGTDRSPEVIDGETIYWEHFAAELDSKFVMPEDEIAPYLSKRRGIRDVFVRGLQTITPAAIDTVVDLLANGSLYRGEEKESNLTAFREAVVAYNKIKGELPRLMWALNAVDKMHPAIARMRNTSMGTLLVDIEEGVDLEDAVKKYEKIMAPENYQRTTAIITKAMKDKAEKFVKAEGIEDSLHRRHAKPTDITVNNVLFTNRKARSLIAGSVFDELEVATAKPDFSRVESVSIEDFLTKILPKAEALELFMDNTHTGNLVSLTAPVYADAKPILKWDNNFCWSYNGEVTDSIKEKVKAAGGVVEADLCCRLAWWNTDDLDIHMEEPNGTRINFRDRVSPDTGGQLDIDMNSPSAVKTNTPVENIFYKDRSRLRDGTYTVRVNNYQMRERSNGGFEVNLDFMGRVWRFNTEKHLKSDETMTVVKFKFNKKTGIEIVESIPFTTKSTVEWGVTTQSWTPVNMVMLSPNHWDDNKVGNKHWFFMLDGCLNPEPVRGFYNEFLSDGFREHRKVFEILGAKIKAPNSDQQLSGLGFSSTQRNHVMCRVSGAFNRVIKIVF